VLPFLQQKDSSCFTGIAIAYERHVRSIDEARVLCSVDEAGQVAIVSVWPARGLVGDQRQILGVAMAP